MGHICDKAVEMFLGADKTYITLISHEIAIDNRIISLHWMPFSIIFSS